MKKSERTGAILELLTKKEKADVVELSELLDVSQVTIRKDLDELEERGFIVRQHGYAQLKSNDDISSRLAYHYAQKKAIAEKALELIRDGDTIMIESGSCCALLASLISTKRKNITMITNSVFIAHYIKDSNVQVILLGGIYQHDSECLVGPSILQNVQKYHVQYFFIGTDGYSDKTGFTNKDQLRSQAVSDMSESAEKVVILTESEKFHSIGTCPMNMNHIQKMVITDQQIEESTKQHLLQQNIDVQTI